MNYGVFELAGLNGVAAAEGSSVMGIRMVFPNLPLGLFNGKALVLSLVRPDCHAPDLSYVRYSWRVPVAPSAVRRFAQTPISGNNSPTAFQYQPGEAAEVSIEWQVVDGVVQGRYTSDTPLRAALLSLGCFAPAEVALATVDGLRLVQAGVPFHVRLAGNSEAPLTAGDERQMENALLWPGFAPSGNALTAHPVHLSPESPLHFSLALHREPPAPVPHEIDAALAAAAHRYEAERMRSAGNAPGMAEAVAALSGYSRAYDPKRRKIQTTVNRTWGGPGSPGLCFGWDNFFTSYIAAWENPRLASESLEHIVGLYSENGPEYGPTQRNLIIPIVYCRTIETTGNMDLARRTWPAMMAFMRFWFADRGDGIAWRDGNGDGLIEPGSSLDPASTTVGAVISAAMDETGYDELPTYSDGFTDQRRPLPAEGVRFDTASKCLTVSLVCQNSLYVASCKKMAILAARLGEDASRAWLEAEAQRVSALIAEKLFDPARGYHTDRRWDGTFSPTKTLTIFFPLLAGLPNETVRERLRLALLDPRQFWGDNLVPTVSRDDPAYRDGIDGNGNYWRGNCWPPTTYICWLAVREAGWYDLSAMIAEKAAAQFMRYWTPLGHAYENYPAEGEVDHSYIYAGGCWGGREIRYVWSALMPLCLLEEVFAVETVGDGFRFGNPFLSKETTWNGFLCQGRRVEAAASPDCTRVVFDGDWSFESKPGLAVRDFVIGDDAVSFGTGPLGRNAEIRIRARCFGKKQIPRVVVNGHEIFSLRFDAGEQTLVIALASPSA